MSFMAGTFLPIEALGGIDAEQEEIFAPMLKDMEEDGNPVEDCACFPVNGDWRDALMRAILWPGDEMGVFVIAHPEKMRLPDDPEYDENSQLSPVSLCRMDTEALRSVSALTHSPQKASSWSEPDIRRMIVTRHDGKWVYGGLKAPDELVRAMKYAQTRIFNETQGAQEFRDMRFLFIVLPVFLCTVLNAKPNDEKVSADYFPLLFSTRFLVECRRRFVRWMESGGKSEDFKKILGDISLIGSLPAEPKHSGTGRNDPCFCGSGKKYKKCHMKMFD